MGRIRCRKGRNLLFHHRDVGALPLVYMHPVVPLPLFSNVAFRAFVIAFATFPVFIRG